MRHMTIWHRLINVDALLQDQNKKTRNRNLSARHLDCLVSGTTTNWSVTSISLQNGNSFSSPQTAANSLATGVHCSRVEALRILWESKQDNWKDLRDLLFIVFSANRGGSHASGAFSGQS